MKLLLDAHIPAVVARELSSQQCDAAALRTWRDGRYLDSTDDMILRAAQDEGRVLVTYDIHTLPSLLKQWVEDGSPHAGVILISVKTIVPSDVGSLTRALQRLCERSGDQAWDDRTVFLER